MEASNPDFVIEFKRVENEQKYSDFSIPSVVLDKLKSQQNQRFFNFRQFKVLSKIHIAFIIEVKIHKKNLLPKPVNY